jgi:hypothetical protein
MKIVSIVGAALIVVGVAGLVPLASNTSEVLTTRGEFATPEVSRVTFFSEYVFIFMIVGGAVLLSYGLVSLQRKKNAGR